MALTRTMLKAMDSEKENIDKIIEAHAETVDALKETRDSYKEKADKYDSLSKEFEEYKQNTPDKTEYDKLKDKYDKLQGEYDDYKNDIDTKAKKATKTEAYKSLLEEVGISDKRINSVVRVADLSSIELDEDGKIKDADKLKESIKEEWGDFITTKSEKGANPANPPAKTSGKAMTKEEILAIKDTTERQRAMAENHELFGIE